MFLIVKNNLNFKWSFFGIFLSYSAEISDFDFLTWRAEYKWLPLILLFQWKCILYEKLCSWVPDFLFKVTDHPNAHIDHWSRSLYNLNTPAQRISARNEHQMPGLFTPSSSLTTSSYGHNFFRVKIITINTTFFNDSPLIFTIVPPDATVYWCH